MMDGIVGCNWKYKSSGQWNIQFKHGEKMNQCCRRSPMPYGVTRPSWIKFSKVQLSSFLDYPHSWVTMTLIGHRPSCVIWFMMMDGIIGCNWRDRSNGQRNIKCEYGEKINLVNEHWFRWWLAAIRQQAITSTSTVQTSDAIWCHKAIMSLSKEK